MTLEKLEADYLVVGSGAMGMAFTDVLMTETDATVLLVDRHHQPGGHWNDAYPFVRLHQPSAFYGVNSRKLGSDTIDATGWNQGLYELATNSEVCAYFDQVMNQQFLSSGRVQYFPMCEYEGSRRFRSHVADTTYEVSARKIVDSTYMNVTVPSVRGPLYDVAPDVHCVPLNALPRDAGSYERYVVIGAGKTGMDACLFLLKNGVDPDAITWIMPRDSWMLDRANIQPGGEFTAAVSRGFAMQLEAAAKADSVEDLFDRVEAGGQLLRLDPDVRPTMFRCATVTQLELAQLRRIANVVRMGHVKQVSGDLITLDGGILPTGSNTLHVDCSADGLANRPVVPVFQGDQLTLQSVRTCQQVFSAAFIAHAEAAYEGDVKKNQLCTPVPHPNTDIDFLRVTLANSMNQLQWAQDPELQQWLKHSRLDGFTRAIDPANAEANASFLANAGAALQKLQAFLTALDA